MFGYFIGAILLSLLFGAVGLIICSAIPPLRKNIGVSHGIAIALTFVPSFVTIDGPNIMDISGSLFSAGLLFWRYKRKQKKLLSSINRP